MRTETERAIRARGICLRPARWTGDSPIFLLDRTIVRCIAEAMYRNLSDNLGDLYWGFEEFDIASYLAMPPNCIGADQYRELLAEIRSELVAKHELAGATVPV